MDVELFRDRTDAGRVLAQRLLDYQGHGASVLAIPRGGVPVGFEVAESLGARFDVIVPRKIPIPWNPEAGFGAVTADGTVVLNESMVRGLGLDREEIDQAADRVLQDVLRQTTRYRGNRPPLDVRGRPVIIVDDGVASGLTMLAAIESVRRLEPSEIVVAVSVASSGAVRLLNRACGKLVAVIVSERLPFAVARFFRVWSPVTDDDICAYMHRAESLNEGMT